MGPVYNYLITETRKSGSYLLHMGSNKELAENILAERVKRECFKTKGTEACLSRARNPQGPAIQLITKYCIETPNVSCYFILYSARVPQDFKSHLPDGKKDSVIMQLVDDLFPVAMDRL